MDEQIGCFGSCFAKKVSRQNFSNAELKSQRKTKRDAIGHPLLVSELNQLSVKEREHVYEEIHGVAEIPKETPEMRREALAQLRQKLTALPRRKKQAFSKALFLKPSLEQDENFLMMFLRADRFDAAKAADRLTTYFENKLSLFGEAKLVKKITQDDLSPDDRASLMTGGFQVFPGLQDQRGRPIWLIIPKQLRFTDPLNVVSNHRVLIITTCMEFGSVLSHAFYQLDSAYLVSNDDTARG